MDTETETYLHVNKGGRRIEKKLIVTRSERKKSTQNEWMNESTLLSDRHTHLTNGTRTNTVYVCVSISQQKKNTNLQFEMSKHNK